METSSMMTEMMAEMLSLLREISNKIDTNSLARSTNDGMMKVENYYDIHTMSQNNIYDSNRISIDNYINSTPSAGVASPSPLSDEQRVSNLSREYREVTKLHERDIHKDYPVCLYKSKSKSYCIDRSGFNQDIIRLVTRNSFIHFHNDWGPNIYPVYALSTSDILAKCACSEQKIDLNVSITMFNYDNIRDYINLSKAIGIENFNVLQFIQNSIDAYKSFITENVSNRNSASSAIDKVLMILAGFGMGFISASVMV